MSKRKSAITSHAAERSVATQLKPVRAKALYNSGPVCSVHRTPMRMYKLSRGDVLDVRYFRCREWPQCSESKKVSTESNG